MTASISASRFTKPVPNSAYSVLQKGSSKKRPRDINKLLATIVDEATGEGTREAQSHYQPDKPEKNPTAM